MYLAAVVQLTSTSDAVGSMASADALVRRAARYGATFVATPEATNYLGPHDEKVRLAETLDGPTPTHFSALAAELGIHLLLGSFNERSEDSARCHNTSVLFAPDGSRVAHYRKIHLFDVDHSQAVRFLESDTTAPGVAPMVAHTDVGRIGMSICYDLRFPGLYQACRDQGAEVLTVPSAFTLTTGKDHWQTLLRSRAIENQAYVLAPGQVGHHDDGGLRDSWGHSMIIDPWGDVVGCAPDGPGLALAEIDLQRVAAVRRGMPVHQHRRY